MTHQIQGVWRWLELALSELVRLFVPELSALSLPQPFSSYLSCFLQSGLCDSNILCVRALSLILTTTVTPFKIWFLFR